MPKVLEDRVAALKRDGYPEDQAYAIATAALRREGQLPKKGPAKEKKDGKR